MAIAEVQCPLCKSYVVVKFGMSREGTQCYQCRHNECEKHTFLLENTDKAYLPGVKEKIIEMAMNGSGKRKLPASQHTISKSNTQQ